MAADLPERHIFKLGVRKTFGRLLGNVRGVRLGWLRGYEQPIPVSRTVASVIRTNLREQRAWMG